MRIVRVGCLIACLCLITGLLAPPRAAAETFCLDSRVGVQKRFAVEPTACATGENLLCYSTALTSWSACTSGETLQPIAAGGNFGADGPTNAFQVCGAPDKQNCPINAYVDAVKGPINKPICSGVDCDLGVDLASGKTFTIAQTDGNAGIRVSYSEIEAMDLRCRATDAATPTTDRLKFYCKTGSPDALFMRNDAGTVTQLGAGGGSTSRYFDAVELVPDGTNCVAGVLQLNGGPVTDIITCGDSNSSIIYGKSAVSAIGGCPASTLNMSMHLYHATTETITFAGDFSAMYRRWATTDVINATWGTAVAADVAITTQHEIETATASVTPNGTCSATSFLFFRYVVDATNFSANAANSRVLGVTIAHP